MSSAELSGGDDTQAQDWLIHKACDDVLEVVAILLVDALTVQDVQFVVELAVVCLGRTGRPAKGRCRNL